jgi:NAD(P)-dependent dehydrogenase (short-subunit alcohol dehydrogenase family)
VERRSQEVDSATTSDLTGRVVVVTGAGRGIGRGIALHLARAGAVVAVAEHRRSRLDDVLGELEATGAPHLGVECDVGSREQMAALVARTVAAFGRVDGLVNNAQRLAPITPLEEVTEAAMELVHRSGALGTLWGMQAVFPHMRDQGWGRIVNVASANGIRGASGTGPYNATKEAIRALTRTAAREWAPHGIVVNCFCPAAAGHHPRPSEGDLGYESWHAMYAMHPMGRDGDPEADIAPVAAFLLSDACRYVNGETIMVDGGGWMRA